MSPRCLRNLWLMCDCCLRWKNSLNAKSRYRTMNHKGRYEAQRWIILALLRACHFPTYLGRNFLRAIRHGLEGWIDWWTLTRVPVPPFTAPGVRMTSARTRWLLGSRAVTAIIRWLQFSRALSSFKMDGARAPRPTLDAPVFKQPKRSKSILRKALECPSP